MAGLTVTNGGLSEFDVSTRDVFGLSADFAGQAPGLIAHLSALTSATMVSTGNLALDALIARLAGEVAASLSGAALALQADSVRLTQSANRYVGADQVSTPRR
jgi:hypothetical protein